MNQKIFILLFFLIVCCLINQSQSARKCRKPGKKIKTAIDSIESKIESKIESIHHRPKINTNQQQLWNPTQSLAMNQQWTNGFGQQLTGLNPIVSSIENLGNNNLLTNPFGILVNRPADSSSTSKAEINVPVSLPNQGLSSPPRSTSSSSSSIAEVIEHQFAPWKESTSSSASSPSRGSSVDLQEAAALELNKMLQKAQSAQWNIPKIQQQSTFYSSSSSSSAASSSSESQVKLISPESLSITASSVSPQVTLTAKASPLSTLVTKASPVPHPISLTSSFRSPSVSSSEIHTKQLPSVTSSVSSPAPKPTRETQVSVQVTKVPSELSHQSRTSKITIKPSPSAHIDIEPSQTTERISPISSAPNSPSSSITTRVTQVRMKRPPNGTEYKKESDYVNPNIVIPKLEFYHNLPKEEQVNGQKPDLQFSRESVSSTLFAPSSTNTLSYDQQQELASLALVQILQKEQSNRWNNPNKEQHPSIYSASSASASSKSESESGITFDSPINWPQKELLSSESSSYASLSSSPKVQLISPESLVFKASAKSDSSTTASSDLKETVNFSQQWPEKELLSSRSSSTSVASSSSDAEVDTQFGKVLKDSSSSSASAKTFGYDQQQELAAQALAQILQKEQSNQWNKPTNEQQSTIYSASSALASSKSESGSGVTFDSPTNWPQKESLSPQSLSSAPASSADSFKAEPQPSFWKESISPSASAESLSTDHKQFLAALEYSELLKKAQSTASSNAEVVLTPLIFSQRDGSSLSSSVVALDKLDINQQQTPSFAISSQDSAASQSKSLQSPLSLSQILKRQFASSGESQSTNNQRKPLETFGQSHFSSSLSPVASSAQVDVQGNQDNLSSQAAQRRSQDQKQVNLSQSESASSSSSSSSSSSQIQSVLTVDQPQSIELSKSRTRSKTNSQQSEQDETLSLEKKLNNQQIESSSSAEAQYRVKSASEGQTTIHHRTSQSLTNLLNALRNQLKVTNQQLTGDQTEDMIILQLRREISRSRTIEQLQQVHRIMINQPAEIQQAIKLQLILKAVQLQQAHNEQSTAEEIDSVQRLILSLIEQNDFMEHGTGLLEEITSGVESVVSDIIG